MHPAAVGRPGLMGTRTSMTLAEGMTGMIEGVFVNVKNRSKTITAEIEVAANGGSGTVIAQGGRFGGCSLYVKDGVPAYDYNFLGMQHTSMKVAEGRIAATQPGIFSADETADVGIDLGTPVVEALGSEAKSRFTGRIPTVFVLVK